MKMNRAMSTPLLPSLLVALAGALAWGVGAPASAAPTASSVQASVSGQVGGTSGVQAQSSSASPTGPVTEGVTFSGNAVVTARVAADPDFRTPDIVVLLIDLSGVSGVGATSKKKYVTSNKAVIQRRLRPTDSVKVTFPFRQSGTTETGSGLSGTVTINLTYDVNTKRLIAAAGSVTSQ